MKPIVLLAISAFAVATQTCSEHEKKPKYESSKPAARSGVLVHTQKAQEVIRKIQKRLEEAEPPDPGSTPAGPFLRLIPQSFPTPPPQLLE